MLYFTSCQAVSFRWMYTKFSFGSLSRGRYTNCCGMVCGFWLCEVRVHSSVNSNDDPSPWTWGIVINTTTFPMCTKSQNSCSTGPTVSSPQCFTLWCGWIYNYHFRCSVSSVNWNCKVTKNNPAKLKLKLKNKKTVTEPNWIMICS